MGVNVYPIRMEWLILKGMWVYLQLLDSHDSVLATKADRILLKDVACALPFQLALHAVKKVLLAA